MRNLSVIKGLYQGNGVTRRWAIPFEYNDTAQIFVTITTYDEGDYTYRVLDSTEYTIDEDSVEIVYPKTDDDAPIPSTQYLTVWRDTDLLQLMDLTNQGAAWPDSIEAALDKLHQIVQELAEGLSRSLKVDIGDPQTPDEKLVAIQDYVLAAAESSRSASSSAVSANQAAESAATSAANAAESERLAGGYADTASDAASRAEDSAISARAYNAPDYNNETTYQAGAVVTFTDGNSYRALQETTGNAPTNIIYWQKVTDYVGDDFFEVDEYGYIVPMDSPSHSRYWRVDQNGYIVPIEGGDGGYRPDTRSLSAEYLNVTNEGYIKHMRADDVNAGNLSATGNVTAGMVTTPQANVTTLTANTANVTALTAGTLTANDIIAKGPWVDVRAFGAKGDGVTDDTAAFNTALENSKIVYVPPGTYLVVDVVVPKFTTLMGAGKSTILKGLTTGTSVIKTSANASKSTIKDLYIEVPDRTINGITLSNYTSDGDGDSTNTISNVIIKKADNGVLVLDGQRVCLVDKVKIYNCNNGIVMQGTCSDNIISKCEVGICKKYGYNISASGGNNTIIASKSFMNGSDGDDYAGFKLGSYNMMIGCISQGEYYHSINLLHNCTIKACYLYGVNYSNNATAYFFVGAKSGNNVDVTIMDGQYGWCAALIKVDDATFTKNNFNINLISRNLQGQLVSPTAKAFSDFYNYDTANNNVIVNGNGILHECHIHHVKKSDAAQPFNYRAYANGWMDYSDSTGNMVRFMVSGTKGDWTEVHIALAGTAPTHWTNNTTNAFYISVPANVEAHITTNMHLVSTNLVKV